MARHTLSRSDWIAAGALCVSALTFCLNFQADQRAERSDQRAARAEEREQRAEERAKNAESRSEEDHKLSIAADDRATKAEIRARREEELFKRQVVAVDMNNFNQFIDSAKPYFPCSGPLDYLIRTPLSQAEELEPVLRDHLTAPQYLMLAALGNTIWEHDQMCRYLDQALTKSRHPFDRHVAHMLLAHSHFVYHKNSGGRSVGSLTEARRNIKESITVVAAGKGAQEIDVNSAYLVGTAYEEWMALEAYTGHSTEAEEAQKSAETYLYSDGDRKELHDRLYLKRKRAENGEQPQLPCPSVLFASSRPSGLLKPIADEAPVQRYPKPATPRLPPEGPIVGRDWPTQAEQRSLRPVQQAPSEPPGPRMGSVVLDNQTGRQQWLLLNGAPHVIAHGQTKFLVPFGVVNIQFSQSGPIWQYGESKWTWTGDGYRLAIPVVLGCLQPDPARY